MANFKQNLNQWLSSLENIASGGIEKNLVIKNLISLSSVGTPVCVNTKLVGTQKNQALEKDQAYVGYYNQDNHSAAEKQLIDSPATGCAMIMTLAQNAAGFNPSAKQTSSSMSNFLNYVSCLEQCPAIDTEISDQLNLGWTGNWGTMINSITDCYVGIDPKDIQTIQKSLWSIASAAASSPNTNEVDDLFVQNAMNVDSEIRIYMYKSLVSMVEEKHKGSGKNAPTIIQNKTNLQLFRHVFKLDLSKWPSYAPTLMKKTNASLGSWLNDNSTPEGKVPVSWTCDYVPNFKS